MGPVLAAEQALAGSLAKSVSAMSKKSLEELKAALAEAAGKFSPDRTVLPMPDRSFGGTAGRTVDQSVPDCTMIPRPKAPDGAPNVLVVLTERPVLFPAWDSLSDAQKKLYAWQMEVFAGYSENARLERRPATGRHPGDGRPGQHAHLLHLG
jgi:hypothetical protein